MNTRRESVLIRLALHVWRYKLTACGRILVVMGVVVGTFASPSIEVPVFYILFALFPLGAVAWFVNLFLRPRVEVSGVFPGRATTEHPVTGLFRVRNLGRLPLFDVAAGFFGLGPRLRQVEPERHLPVLARGGAVEFPVTLLPRRRGAYALPMLRVFTTFPFNICRSGPALRAGGTLLVLPRFHPIAAVDLPVGSRYQPGGIALTSDVGESPEYIGNREYRPGDPTRRIDARAWARLAAPVVREFREEYYCRIALVLDTYMPRRTPWRLRAAGSPELEAAVSLSAAVADALSRGEYIIDLFAAGPELYVFRAGRHTAHLDNVLEILACVEECRRNPFEVVAPALSDELGNISTVISVLLDWDASRQRLLRAAVEAGCGVKTFIVRDGPTTEPYEAAEDWAGPIVQLSCADVLRGGLERL